MAFVQSDQVFKTKVERNLSGSDEFVTTIEQPSRNLILERNSQLRNNNGAMNDLSFGRQLASIPLEDWEWFLRHNPNYRKVDKVAREKMLFNFLRNTQRGRDSMVVEEGSKQKYHSVIK